MRSRQLNTGETILILIISLLIIRSISNSPQSSLQAIVNSTPELTMPYLAPGGGGGGQTSQETTPLIIYTLVNGGFEQGSTGWTIRHGFSLDNATGHTGQTSLRCDSTYYNATEDPTRGDARASWTNQRMNVSTGQKVIVSGYIKVDAADCVDGLRIGVDFKNSTWGILRAHNGPFVPWGSNWTYISFEETVRQGEERITLWLQGRPYNCSASGWFDDLSLQITT